MGPRGLLQPDFLVKRIPGDFDKQALSSRSISSTISTNISRPSPERAGTRTHCHAHAETAQPADPGSRGRPHPYIDTHPPIAAGLARLAPQLRRGTRGGGAVALTLRCSPSVPFSRWKLRGACPPTCNPVDRGHHRSSYPALASQLPGFVQHRPPPRAHSQHRAAPGHPRK